MGTYTEQDILEWVYEESKTDSGGSGRTPVQLLIVRISIDHKKSSKSLTESVELSLDEFDRMNLYRILRHLNHKRLVDLVDSLGVPLSQEQIEQGLEDHTFLGCVTLTEKGKEDVTTRALCK